MRRQIDCRMLQNNFPLLGVDLRGTIKLMFGIIYLITNMSDGKQYVGQTTHTLEWRWKLHLSWAKKNLSCALHHAIRKYGVEAFKVEQLDSAESREELNKKEAHHIAWLKTLAPNGYNLTTGGEGFDISEVTRQRISLAGTGRFVSEETCKKISDSLRKFPSKTHCRRGHLLSGENLYITPSSGERRCLVCSYSVGGHRLPERLLAYAK